MSGHYSARQRRALNQIWNAAGVYGFDPLFLSIASDGTPNLYLNTIVGCVHKWYGGEGPERLFESWAGDRRQALLDDLAWLALESAAYRLELPERPLLEALRREYAAAFFDQEYQLSRQEWMAKNQLSYTLQSARWKAVLSQRPPIMNPYEKRLSAALDRVPLDGDALFQAILEIFARFRLFDGKARPPSPLRLHLKGRWAGVMTRLLPTQIVQTDMAAVNHTAAKADADGPKPDPRRASVIMKEDAKSDRMYIESCFGPSLLSPRELAAAEQELCTGIHLGCRLWYTAGVPSPERASNPEARYLAQQAQLQCQRNQAAFAADSALYQNAIRRLTQLIQNCLQVHSQYELETARYGRINTPKVWRAAVLSDGRVFLRDAGSARPGFTVDLLLDCSSSRLHCQEAIASQGYILSESLHRCGVNVRVSGFCSLRGYTILRVLKGFQDKSRSIFRYFATGWNRDGLALRAAGSLLQAEPEHRRLLLLLTDASPNDSRRIPPSSTYPFGCEYADAPAVEDAAQEVRALRRRGIHVGAVFMGPSLNAPAADIIYGRSLARIRSMDQLAAAAGTLIQDAIRELDAD